jgi:glycosyltransferase involved in cell wall biosynthesis
VVHNGIDLSRFAPRDKAAARAALELPPGKTIFGTIGRVEFNQKQQDFLVRTFSTAWRKNPAMHLVIAGDGPDRGRLEALVSGLGLQEQITMLPWQADSAMFYSALDLLVIPSRFEGVPLVMLEAIACGIPVIGSARDGMKDMLPAAWTFETENSAALVDTAEYVSQHWAQQLPALQAGIHAEYSVGKFQQNFEAVLHGFL